jgi:hypothetical protein
MKNSFLFQLFKDIVLAFKTILSNTGGPRLVRFLGPGKNRTMQNSY